MDDLFTRKLIPLDQWITDGVEPILLKLRPIFQALKWPIEQALYGLQTFLSSVSPVILLLLLFLLAWQTASLRVGIFCVLAMTFIGLIGMWKAAMITIALVVTAVFFCLLIGIPLGLWAGRSDRVSSLIRPVLDVMQTLPAFAYLVPVVMLLGIGNVPGVAITIVFGLPPIVRLTDLGIRQVPANLVEAGHAFGSTPRQILWRIQIPLAMRSIMTGINQTLMMALAMTVITSMIAVEGLGMEVLRGIGRLDMGLACAGGISIVLVAMVCDRVSQVEGIRDQRARSWTERGPVGIARTVYQALRPKSRTMTDAYARHGGTEK